MKTVFFIFLLFPLLINHPLFSQIIIQGIIQDAKTGSVLPAANIQIENTYYGTISNDDGNFILNITNLPAIIKISYIGYASERIEISEKSGENLVIKLQPIAYELDPIVISGEDPAIGIMRKVIERKKIWRKNLKTYQADAYTRIIFENDTSVTSIMESISTAYWDQVKGSREIIKSKRQTSNMEQNENFANVSYITNLYDDDIEFAGFKLIGVTHPDALKFYDFKLEGQRRRDEHTVFDISVAPKSKLTSGFLGNVSVLDEEFALLEVDLKPSEAVMFPPPIQDWEIHYQQQYDNFGDVFWVPIDVRTTGMFKVGFVLLQFPSFKIKRISRLTNYQYNVEFPDTIYQQKKVVTVDSISIMENTDSIFTKNPEVVPFTKEEQEAYVKLDSTKTLAKAYQPTGPLSRFVNFEDEDESNRKTNKKNIIGTLFSQVDPHLGFNRVDGFHLGLTKSLQFSRKLRFQVTAGYNTGIKREFYGVTAEFHFPKNRNWRIQSTYFNSSQPRTNSPNYSSFFSSVHTLLGFGDYFDYYWNKKIRVEIRRRTPFIKGFFSVGINYERHSNLKETTSYNLLSRNQNFRINPIIPDGNLNSINFRIILGDDYIPFGFVGQNRLELFLEKSSPNIFKSKFNYMLYHIMADFRINTFFHRRLLPNALDIHIIAGTSTGTIPPQRFGMIDGSLQAFTPFGVIKTLLGEQYEGEKYLGAFFEHNFRTIPFEIIGWRWIAKNNIGMIIHGAVAKSWTSDKIIKKWQFDPKSPHEFHRELGLSITGLFSLLRIDGSYRLDQPGFYLGFGMSRFF